MQDISTEPKHIAFIMDGNGRWAKARGKNRSYGHKKGAEILQDVIKVCHERGVKVVSLYAFSTENWSRPKEEIDEIMSLFSNFLKKFTSHMIKYKTKLIISGDTQPLGKELHLLCKDSMLKTSQFTEHIINIAVNYGGRAELVHAFNKLIKAGKTEILQSDIQNSLYTAGLPDVDLLVRTSGEQRLSNFMLYQSAYAELYFTDTLWPDFNFTEVNKAIDWYASRKRRFGGI